MLLGVIALSTVGLATVDAVTYTSLRTFLVQRAQDTLDAAEPSIALQMTELQGQGIGLTPSGYTTLVQSLAIPGECLQLRKINGRLLPGAPNPTKEQLQEQQLQGGAFPNQDLVCLPLLAQTEPPPSPRLPTTISVPAISTRRDSERVAYFDARAASGGGIYRVRASVGPSAPQFMVVLATPLSGVHTTLHRLLVIELIVSAAVLLALVTLGLWVVRLGLRPLEAIGKTAAAIASGDLSQRIEHTDEKTEVGRLGGILNAMLTQIETAFRAREATEQKLRRFVADA